jgi:hypothetical protein
VITLDWADVVAVFVGGAAFSLWSFYAYLYVSGRVLRGYELAVIQEVMKQHGLNSGAARKFIVNEYARLSGLRPGEAQEGNENATTEAN